MTESIFIAALCSAMFGGTPEVTHNFTYPTGAASIRVDCENTNRVIEFGLDKRSSLDSVQQALFASEVTGKEPVVVIIDRDGDFGRFEWRIARAVNIADVPFILFPAELAADLGVGG